MPTKFFPWKFINLLALILFITCNTIIRVKENQIYDDTRMQFANAQAWRQGYGVSLLYADPRNLAKVAPRVVEFWPPGYAVFTGSFLHLTNDVQLAGWMTDIMGIVVFFVAWYLIGCRLIPFTVPFFPVVLMLPWGFGFLFKWLPTVDMVAMSWHLLGVAFLVEWVAGGQRKTVWLVACSLAVFMACFFRFAYYPMAFLPAGILMGGALLGNRNWWKPGLLVLALTGVLVSAQIIYQHFVAKSVNYLTERHAGHEFTIHWDNLKMFTPFVTTSIPGASLLPFSESVSDVILLLLILAGSAILAFSVLRLTGTPRQTVYIWLAGAWFSFWLNVAFMVFLSLYYPPESWGPWTYVMEIRYFGLNMAIVSGMLMFLLFWKGTSVPKFLRYFLYVIALVISIHAYAFASFKSRVHEPIAYSEPFATAATVQQLVQKIPGPVVFATDQLNNYWDVIPMTSMAIFGAMGGAPIIHINSLIQSHPSSEPVTVLVAIVHAPPAGLDALYKEGNARQVGILDGRISLMQLSLPATLGRDAPISTR